MPKDLTKYDVDIAIDKSGSMSSAGNHGLSRWGEAKEVTIALAAKASQFDQDGIIVIPFANTHKIYDIAIQFYPSHKNIIEFICKENLEKTIFDALITWVMFLYDCEIVGTDFRNAVFGKEII